MPAKVDWSEELRRVRLRLLQSDDVIAEYAWLARLTSWDVWFLSTLGIRP